MLPAHGVLSVIIITLLVTLQSLDHHASQLLIRLTKGVVSSQTKMVTNLCVVLIVLLSVRNIEGSTTSKHCTLYPEPPKYNCSVVTCICGNLVTCT